MNIIYLYLGLAIAIGLVGYYYFLFFRTKKKPHADVLFTDALNYMVKGDSTKAINLLKKVVKQNSNHVRAYLQLGNILRTENPEQAIKIHQSLTVRPNLSLELKVDIHRALADDYRIVGNLLKSKEEAQLILGIEKRNLWALKFLIDIAEQNQDWDEAASWTKQLQKVTGKKNNNNETRFDVYRGLDCLNTGQIEQAKTLFKKAIKTSPDFPISYRYLGDVYEQRRDLVKALENWEKFAKKDLKNGFLVYGKIESALFDLGRYSEVENFYRRILETDTPNFEATIRLANVLEEKGESGSALTLIEDMLSNDSLDITVDLMKLKLSISTSTPVELAHQIDVMLEKLLTSDES